MYVYLSVGQCVFLSVSLPVCTCMSVYLSPGLCDGRSVMQYICHYLCCIARLICWLFSRVCMYINMYAQLHTHVHVRVCVCKQLQVNWKVLSAMYSGAVRIFGER